MAQLNLKRLNSIQLQFGLQPISAKELLLGDDLNWVVNIAEILRKLSIMPKALQYALGVRKAQIKMQLAKAETELNKTEQQLGLNLLSFEYRDREHDAMVFQVGVNIPVGTKFSAATSQYDLSTAQAQLDTSVSTLQKSLAEMATGISWLAEELALINSQIQQGQKNLQRHYAISQPLLAINLRKQLIEQHKRSADIQHKVLYLYINYLAQSGELVQQPLRNWIRKGTPEIEPREQY